MKSLTSELGFVQVLQRSYVCFQKDVIFSCHSFVYQRKSGDHKRLVKTENINVLGIEQIKNISTTLQTTLLYGHRRSLKDNERQIIPEIGNYSFHACKSCSYQ
jgi:hypothetical protein